MIKVYPSALDGEPLEVHQTTRETTLREWLTENAPQCDREDPPIVITINGVEAGLDCSFLPSDEVHVKIVGRGPIAIIIVAVLITAAAMLLLMPDIPKSEVRAGEGLKSASLSANSARYGEPIPEIAGSPPRIYPDYLVPTRTYYTSPTIQWVEAFLCVGKGEFQKSVNDVYIGDTRAPALGNDVELKFYEPGEDVSGESAADWWHSPKEVGFTSRGNAGMELGTISDRTPSISANRFTVAGDVISIASGGAFPDDWGTGMELRVVVPYPATITAGSPRDIIRSEHAFSHFTPTVGLEVSLAGGESGTYKIHSYIPPSAGSPAVPGSPSTYTGSAVPSTLDYSSTPVDAVITVPAGQYSIYLDGTYSTDTALVAAINSQLNASPIVASLDSGKVVFAERGSPYSGVTISISGSGLTALVGGSPVSVAGVKTEAATGVTPGEITLSDMDDNPVDWLQKGATQLAMAPNDFTYLVVDKPSSIALRLDTPYWQNLTSTAIDVSLGLGSQSVGWTGPFTVTPSGECCDAIEYDVQFPQGLVGYDDWGNTKRVSMAVRYEYRVNGGSWAGVTKTYSASSPDARGYTERISVPSTSHNVEVRVRTTVKPQNTSKVRNVVQWTGLRARLVGAPTVYPGVTTLAVKLRTGDRMSKQTDNQVWLKATRILPLMGGGTGATRDIAPFLLHLFDVCGYSDHVDLSALQTLHQLWHGRGDYFDLAIVEHSTVKQVANDALRAGYAELTLDRGMLTPVRDGRQDTVQYMYSPQEFVDYPALTIKAIQPDEIDGVDAEYIDEHTGQAETVKYRLLGGAGRRAEKIKLPGVTNWTKAWRLAARHMRTLAYRRISFKGTTELQALNSSYLSYDRIQDGVPQFGQSGFIIAVNGKVLTVSEDFDFGDDQYRVIALRRLDGKVTPVVWVKRGPGRRQLELVDNLPWPFDWCFGEDGRDPTVIYFGGLRNFAYDVLVTKITPKENGTVDIEAVQYDDRVYMDDDRDPLNEVVLTTAAYQSEILTSLPYPMEYADDLTVEALKPTVSIVQTVFRYEYDNWPVENLTVEALKPTVSIVQTVFRYEYDNWPEENLTVEALAPTVDITITVRRLEYDDWPVENLTVTALAPTVGITKTANRIEYDRWETESLTVTALAPTVIIEGV